MTNKILVATIIGMFFLMGIVFWLKLKEPAPKVGCPPIIPNMIDKTGFDRVSDQPIVPCEVNAVNFRNETIKSFSCSDMEVKLWEGGMRIRLQGSLYYEKPKGFRMRINSVFGEEVDLGSNDDVFWYWSRRNKRKGLYYAHHEDFQKTRLKTPFNPLFIRASLGLDLIHFENGLGIYGGQRCHQAELLEWRWATCHTLYFHQ